VQSPESSLQIVQRALVLLTSHLESFRKRYAYHLRQWQLDRRSVASHHRGLHDKHSVPIHIVIQPASTADKVLCCRCVCYGIVMAEWFYIKVTGWPQDWTTWSTQGFLQNLGLQMNNFLALRMMVTVCCWLVILLELMWNDRWHMKVIITFTFSTFCYDNLWKSIVYSSGKAWKTWRIIFLLLCGHPVVMGRLAQLCQYVQTQTCLNRDYLVTYKYGYNDVFNETTMIFCGHFVTVHSHKDVPRLPTFVI